MAISSGFRRGRTRGAGGGGHCGGVPVDVGAVSSSESQEELELELERVPDHARGQLMYISYTPVSYVRREGSFAPLPPR